MDWQETVKEIIAENTFFTLATTDGKQPWISTVFFAFDKNYHFYFSSYNDALHVKNILKNPHVAISIFNSHDLPGKARGVQIQATCHRLVKNELPEAIEVVYAKRFPDPKERARYTLSVDKFTQTSGRVEHIYVVIPEHFYLIDDAKAVGNIRTEVTMP